MTLTTISKCRYLQAALILVVLTAWIYDMCWLHDRLMHIIWTILASSYCFVVMREILPEFTQGTFILYDIKYIYGHIVPINFISLNSFSAITCLHTNIYAWYYEHIMWYGMYVTLANTKKNVSNTEWQLRLCYPEPKTKWTKNGKKGFRLTWKICIESVSLLVMDREEI